MRVKMAVEEVFVALRVPAQPNHKLCLFELLILSEVCQHVSSYQSTICFKPDSFQLLVQEIEVCAEDPQMDVVILDQLEELVPECMALYLGHDFPRELLPEWEG